MQCCRIEAVTLGFKLGLLILITQPTPLTLYYISGCFASIVVSGVLVGYEITSTIIAINISRDVRCNTASMGRLNGSNLSGCGRMQKHGWRIKSRVLFSDGQIRAIASTLKAPPTSLFSTERKQARARNKNQNDLLLFNALYEKCNPEKLSSDVTYRRCLWQ